MTYEQFLESKKHSVNNFGIEPNFLPGNLFDFQLYVAEYNIRKGRCATFLDTGMGKTIIELVVAKNYIHHTNKPVLIITPLAVAFQFLKEAEKFGIDDIEYSRYGKFTKKIIICNYEMLDHFNANDFDCVILDESSILKNFKGAIKNKITAFLKKIKYRYLFTASPSPNDFIELGTSSEALGYLGYTDMLTKFFTNNEDTISPMNIGVQWLLKGHAREAFFKWVSGWSISARNPADLGFDGSRFILPELIINHCSVSNKQLLVINGQSQLFNIVARTNTEINAERKSTLTDRCKKAVELANPHDYSVYWCNLNPEGDLLSKLDPTARQLKGAMKIEEKEEILLAFYNGEIKKLITKPKITCFGLNWQHCQHTTFFPTFSQEQYYQALRRFWRFGVTKPVTADIIYSDGQQRVLDSIVAKTKKSDELFSKLNVNLNKSFEVKTKGFDKQIQLPKFI